MTEQDGFITTFDSHEQTSSEPTQLEKFKLEADLVYKLVKSMYERTKTEELKQCFGDSMKEADFNTISSDVLRLYNKICIVNYNMDWYEKKCNKENVFERLKKNTEPPADYLHAEKLTVDDLHKLLESEKRIASISNGHEQSELKHGHWIISSDGYYPYCSVCKAEPESGKMTKWCPNCGAKMDEEDNS